MYNKLRLFTPIVATLMLLAAVLAGMTFFFDRTLFYISASLVLVAFVAVLIMLRLLRGRTRRLLAEISEHVRHSMGGAFSELPAPVLTVYGGREIVWYNKLSAQRVFNGKDMLGADISEVLPGISVAQTSPPEGYDVEYGNKQYTAYVACVETQNEQSEPAAVIYLVDDTRLKYFAAEYHETKPGIAFITVDNYNELMQDYTDSERALLMSEIERATERYIAKNNGFLTKVAKDNFIAVIETRGMRKILAGKFELLDTVRAITAGERMPATLSIGLSGEAVSLKEAEAGARQALDMCLGRGGDQAAVKTQNGYEFYGGMSKAIEKRTKVKTRIIANALSELIQSSSNVMLMGHRFADLDCFGAAVGVLKAVKNMGKHGAIVIDPDKNLVRPLLNRILQSGYSSGDFVGPEKAMELVGPRTLLIIIDAHVPIVLESEAVYRAAKTVVVIDHHRRLVGYIDNAVIFYHVPYASSASEMVAELVQYLPGAIARPEAEALMSGIMLDTKNFVMRAGVRTFEAAAWLRRIGADPVEVRKLFSSSMEAYQQKASIIAGANIYRHCAIAISDCNIEHIKTIAPQAADELMSISGVDASFVIFLYEDDVNISARSMGTINVQIIMERLGGGGNLTMAAAQFPGAIIDDVYSKVIQAIDEYHSAAGS